MTVAVVELIRLEIRVTAQATMTEAMATVVE